MSTTQNAMLNRNNLNISYFNNKEILLKNNI